MSRCKLTVNAKEKINFKVKASEVKAELSEDSERDRERERERDREKY